MKRYLAFVLALLAMSTCFISCDEENFVITPTKGCGRTDLSYEVWCDCTQSDDSHSVSWLFLRPDGTFAKYDCKMQLNRSTLSPENETDSVTGVWTKRDKDVILDVKLANGSSENYTLNYDVVDGRCMLINIEDDSEFLFEHVVAKSDTRGNCDIWTEAIAVFKTKEAFEEQIQQATVLVLSYVSSAAPMNLLNIDLPADAELDDILAMLPTDGTELKEIQKVITRIISELLPEGTHLPENLKFDELLQQVDVEVLETLFRSIMAHNFGKNA
jgi:hypothetical protein